MGKGEGQSGVVVTALVLLGGLLGVVLPVLLYLFLQNDGDNTNFGSCLVSPEFRFQCSMNLAKDTLKDAEACNAAWGCWNTTPTNFHPCYHSVPSAFQYYVESRDEGATEWWPQETQIGPVRTGDERLVGVTTRLCWSEDLSGNVLRMDFYQAGVKPDGACASGPKDQGTQPIPIHVDSPQTTGDFFYYHVRRGAETIFDTRLGPMEFNESRVTLSTALPSKFFYGILGGHGENLGQVEVTHGVTSFGENELPFYMVRERSGYMHGLLVETSRPFLAQVIQGPGVSFEFEGNFTAPGSALALNLFLGPSPEQVLQQLNSYLQQRSMKSFEAPPYWALGLHLCRRTRNGTETLKDVQELNPEDADDPEALPHIPYDSDCISANLREPFVVNETRFDQDSLNEITGILRKHQRRVVLSQKLHLGADIVETLVKESEESKAMFVLNGNESSPFRGYLESQQVNYISVFNGDAQDWMGREFQEFQEHGPDFQGLVLDKNFPLDENSSLAYAEAGRREYHKVTAVDSKIDELFSKRAWGNLPPRVVHAKSALHEELSVLHLDVANIYGAESLKYFRDLSHTLGKSANPGAKQLVATGSIGPRSYLYGAFTGIGVPFTWQGLRQSLSHLLRYFMFTPFAGTQICGSFMDNGDLPMDQELSLRWHQLALLLPFARNVYGDEEKSVSRGPLDLNRVYRKHLARNVRDRYALNPYVYTLLESYSRDSVPPVLPMSFHFVTAQAKLSAQALAPLFRITDQFMIGRAILAAPVLYPGTSRTVYFPPGRWYTIQGEEAWSKEKEGGEIQVTALINYVPLFLRDGHTIPTLMNNVEGTAELTRKENYTILTTFPKSSSTASSTGSLFQDDGKSSGSAYNHNRVEFLTTDEYFSWNATAHNCSEAAVSTTIHEVRIFGFPRRPSTIINSVTNQSLPDKTVLYSSDIKLLRIEALEINFIHDLYLHGSLIWYFS